MSHPLYFRLLGMFLLVNPLLLPLFVIAEGSPGAEEEIETLAVVEVLGESLKKTPPPVSFALPSPTISSSLEKPAHNLRPQINMGLSLPPPPHAILLDPTAKERGKLRAVKPLQTTHPTYPRRARGQGWHGTVILRLEISDEGTVLASSVQKSSGITLLDSTAAQSAETWTFVPAQNGEFPIKSLVNIPIRFDLVNQ